LAIDFEVAHPPNPKLGLKNYIKFFWGGGGGSVG